MGGGLMKYALLAEQNGQLITVCFASDVSSDECARYRDRHFPTAQVIGETDPSKHPQSQWRECWRWNGTAVIVDMALARVQRLAEIRTERNKRLAALDPEWMRALGQKRTAEADSIEAKRQALRDIPQVVTPTLATITTPDELETYQPEWPK